MITGQELFEVLLKMTPEDREKTVAISNCDFSIGSYSVHSIDLNNTEIVINQYEEALEEGVRRLWKEKL